MTSQQQQQIVAHKTYIEYADVPTVSCVMVSRGNRISVLEITKRCLKNQTYSNIIEYVFVNGSQTQEEADRFDAYVRDVLTPEFPNIVTSPWIGSKYVGAYRNECNRLAKGDILVNFDDDDYYFPTRVEHSVETLKSTNGSIVGCNDHYIYDFDMKLMCRVTAHNVPNLATNNCMSYNRQFASKHRYDETIRNAEEPSFIGQEYIVPLDYKHMTVQISHNGNTYLKKRIMLESIIMDEKMTSMASSQKASETIEDLIDDVDFIEKMGTYVLSNISKTPKEYDIVYYAGYFQPLWNPESHDLGGSEQAIVHLAQEWVKLGRNVVVYGNIPLNKKIHGVYYKTADEFVFSRKPKILLLWRFSGAILLPLNPQADKIFVDLHDNHSMIPFVKKYTNQIDYIMFKSNYHAQEFEKQICHLEARKCKVLMNGLRIDEFSKKEDVGRDPFRFTYCSSYDRGLVWMVVGLWPVIQKLEPRAELHVYYGIDSVRDEEHKKVLIDAFSKMNIIDHGRQPFEIIRREKQHSTFQLYPCLNDAEIDCISVRESLVAGCIPILTKAGVFKERDGFFIDFDIKDKDSLVPAAIEIVKLARNKLVIDALRTELFKSKTIVSWGDIAKQWDMLFN